VSGGNEETISAPERPQSKLRYPLHPKPQCLGCATIFAEIDESAASASHARPHAPAPTEPPAPRSSGEDLFVVLFDMAPPSQELEPSANPGRFTAPAKEALALQRPLPNGSLHDTQDSPRPYFGRLERVWNGTRKSLRPIGDLRPNNLDNRGRMLCTKPFFREQ
jgi:hypothetical protein